MEDVSAAESDEDEEDEGGIDPGGQPDVYDAAPGGTAALNEDFK